MATPPEPVLVDTNAAAAAADVSPATIRSWANRGKITRHGTDRGSSHRATYDLSEVMHAAFSRAHVV